MARTFHEDSEAGASAFGKKEAPRMIPWGFFPMKGILKVQIPEEELVHFKVE